MPNSVYIHIPYCKLKCNYCSFVSKNIESADETEEYDDTERRHGRDLQ